MILLSELERRIKSMQERVAEPGLEDVVEALVRYADQELITVGYHVGTRSSMLPIDEPDNSYLFRIRIKPHPVETKSRAELVFDLLHEMGHCLDKDTLADADKNTNAKKRDREVRAWDWADQEFTKYPALAPYRALYLTYRAACLVTYPEV